MNRLRDWSKAGYASSHNRLGTGCQSIDDFCTSYTTPLFVPATVFPPLCQSRDIRLCKHARPNTCQSNSVITMRRRNYSRHRSRCGLASWYRLSRLVFRAELSMGWVDPWVGLGQSADGLGGSGHIKWTHGQLWFAVCTLQPLVQTVGWTVQISPAKRRI